jgi:hypothetical protein
MPTVFEIIEDYGEVWQKYCKTAIQRPMRYSRDPSSSPLRQFNQLTKSAIKRFDARKKDKKSSMVTFNLRMLW